MFFDLQVGLDWWFVYLHNQSNVLEIYNINNTNADTNLRHFHWRSWEPFFSFSIYCPEKKGLQYFLPFLENLNIFTYFAWVVQRIHFITYIYSLYCNDTMYCWHNNCPIFRSANAQLDVVFLRKRHFWWRHDYITNT